MYSNKLPGYSTEGHGKLTYYGSAIDVHSLLTRFGGTFLWPTLSKTHKLIKFAQAKRGEGYYALCCDLAPHKTAVYRVRAYSNHEDEYFQRGKVFFFLLVR